jgi:hypothetical protein
MSTLTAERLYALLPSVYRLRDAERPGEPLRALIAALAGQLAVLEENVEQLHDDQFIETCANWAAPYIGDLVGYRPLHGIPADVFSARAEVANTIAYRRRKGTALMLEQLAGDVTGWPAHAVEFFELLATSQYMNHIRLHAPATANLRNLTGCLREGSAFAPFAHTAEMRSPEGGSGRYNIPNIGLFLWRLLPFELATLQLVPDDPTDLANRKFRVNPLGADLKLFRRPRAEDDIAHLSEPINVPEPLSVRLMALAVKAAQATGISPASDNVLDDDYGPGESVVLLRPVPPSTPQQPPIPVSVDDIVICDLRDILDSGGNVIGWNHENSLPQLRPPLPPGKIGLDPERGRVLLENASLGPLLVTFHYGSPSRIGGGDYERTPLGGDLTTTTIVGSVTLPLPLPPVPTDLQPSLNAIAVGERLQIDDSLTYTAATVTVDPPTPGHPEGRVVVAAGNSFRPLVVAPNTGGITLAIAPRGQLVLDGIVFSGGPLHLPAAADDEPRELVLRDCTLVPGLALKHDGSAAFPGLPSLIVAHPFAKVSLLRCITGPLYVAGDVEVTMKDCIVDAGAPENVAYAGPAGADPGGILDVSESTIVGKVHAKRIALASNSIFFAALGPAPPETWTAPVRAERRQQGCVRFCYVPAGSITPRRYRCVPNADHPAALPQFTSLRYGDPGYGQLRGVTDRAIRTGADDESEMGVLHDLYQPQREANLRIRLEEYLRFGLRAGIFYAT